MSPLRRLAGCTAGGEFPAPRSFTRSGGTSLPTRFFLAGGSLSPLDIARGKGQSTVDVQCNSGVGNGNGDNDVRNTRDIASNVNG